MFSREDKHVCLDWLFKEYNHLSFSKPRGGYWGIPALGDTPDYLRSCRPSYARLCCCWQNAGLKCTHPHPPHFQILHFHPHSPRHRHHPRLLSPRPLLLRLLLLIWPSCFLILFVSLSLFSLLSVSLHPSSSPSRFPFRSLPMPPKQNCKFSPQ